MRSKGYAALLAVLIIVTVTPSLTLAQSPMTSAFTYQGQLKEGGSPFTGTVDFDFLLWADPNSVDPPDLLGSVALPGTSVEDGLFTVELDFRTDVYTGEARWLEILVDGTPLNPRQELTPAPFALYALDVAGGGSCLWTLSGSDIYYSDGRVGVGTNDPRATLHVAGHSRFGGEQMGGPPDTDGDYLAIEAEPNQAGWATLRFDQAQLRFWNPNGGELVRLMKDGKLGIGTTTPTEKLTVAGTVESTTGGFKLPDGTIVDDAGDLGGASLWTESGSDIYYDGRYVGIGTPTPAYELHVVRDNETNADLTIENTNPAGETRSGIWLKTLARNWRVENDGALDDIFKIRDSTAGADRLAIDAAGNVGIGAVEPTAKLHVSGDSDTYIKIEAPASNHAGIRLCKPGDAVYAAVGCDNATGDLTLGSWWGDIRFKTNMYEPMIVKSNAVGIGTTSPNCKLHVNGEPNSPAMRVQVDGSSKFIVGADGGVTVGAYENNPPANGLYVAGDVGIGTANPTDALDLRSTSTMRTGIHLQNSNVAQHYILQVTGSDSAGREGNLEIWRNDPWGIGLVMQPDGDVGIGTLNPDCTLHVNGTTKTQVLEITGGSDLSEQFDIAAPGDQLKAGMVVCIDPESPGQLVVSTKAYDRTVAGIISGAGGVQTGMLMGQRDSAADGEFPVALTGRVYVHCDTSNGPIQPGDLLTTSDAYGHAMKVTDHSKAQGAIIGKAMTSLEDGEGLVLVLVSLQ